jgi:LysM repeat protein
MKRPLIAAIICLVLLATLAAIAPATALGEGLTYVVKPGDNLFRIAANHHVTLSALIAANGARWPYIIYPGQVLIIPGTSAPAPTPLPGATPVPTQVPPATNPGFGYGVQAHLLGNDKNRVADAIVGMGFGWVKQQVEWRDVEPSKGNYNWGGLDEVVAAANAKGIRVLFSVLRSPGWASAHPDSPPANFNDYGDFVAALAARYKGKGMAYEVWNEQNLKREWQEYSLSACKYVELLKIGFARIKAADPSAVVVAGALAPTGVNDPNIAIDDRTYLRQLYSCGIRGWFDALGAHPSGFNNPPDADWRTYSDPATSSYKGHPSFFFKATMEDYRNIMVANGDAGRPIWITEFGWAVGAPLTGYEYAQDNTEAERAQWLVRAYQMSKNWGFVGVVFLWNLDFRIVAPGAEQALFGILNSDWSATSSYAALRDMPKSNPIYRVHVVARGETLSRIALRYAVSWRTIASLNGLSNPNLLYVGQRLLIP